MSRVICDPNVVSRASARTSSSTNNLKLRQHDHRPQQVLDALRVRRRCRARRRQRLVPRPSAAATVRRRTASSTIAVGSCRRNALQHVRCTAAQRLGQQRTVRQVERLQRRQHSPGASDTTCSRFGPAERRISRSLVNERRAVRLRPLLVALSKSTRPRSCAAASGRCRSSATSASTNCSAVIRLAIGPANTYSAPASAGHPARPPATDTPANATINRIVLLQVVTVVRQVHGQIIEQVRAPRLGLHRVDRVHDAAAHQPVPQAVDDRPREPAVLADRSSVPPAAAAAPRAALADRSGPTRETSTPASAVLPVGLSQRYISSGPSAMTAARPYVSASFQRSMKLSWHDAHFMFMPRNTCDDVLRELQLAASGWRSRCRAT